MARIGAIQLGGEPCSSQTQPIRSAVAFTLSGPAPLSVVAQHGPWEIELHQQQATIVARSSNVLDQLELLSEGLEFSQRCLDQLSFERHHSITIKDASDEHLQFRTDGLSNVIRHSGVSPISIDVNIEIAITHADGSIEYRRPNEWKPSIWVPGLRFYRLSQASIDVFEAYRNLWLGFESLLDVLSAKRASEREGDWLLRALKMAAQTADLRPFAPAGKDPVMYIIGTQYEHIRLRLFHAKMSANSLPDVAEVTVAYERLIRIWRAIAHDCLGIAMGPSSGTTYAGFKAMMDQAIGQTKLIMAYSDDDTPVSRADVEVSPLGRPTVDFDRVAYLGETTPGNVTILGTLHRGKSPSEIVVRRIGAKIGEEKTLLTLSGFSDPIDLAGIDILESSQTIRLVNRQLPRLTF